jgi:hypothetical protein
VYSAISSGLLAFYVSDLVERTNLLSLLIPSIGAVLSVVWLLSIVRTRERRVYAENRIIAIEKELHAIWEQMPLQILPLDVGTRIKWDDIGRTWKWHQVRLGWIRNISASLLALYVPPTFLVVDFAVLHSAVYTLITERH